MPRRWHSSPRRRVRHHTVDGGKKARSPGRARSKPLKPLRREGRMIRAHLWRLHSCAFLTAHGAAGAVGTRSSPRPHLRVALRPLYFSEGDVSKARTQLRRGNDPRGSLKDESETGCFYFGCGRRIPYGRVIPERPLEREPGGGW